MTDRPATYEDVLATPETTRAELLDGELVLQASPTTLHQRLVSAVTTELRGRFDCPPSDDPERPGGWVIVAGPELWLGAPIPDTVVLCPDVAGWREERFPHAQTTHGITVAPDWVCEVLSPSTHRFDRFRKADAYARAGVSWMWLVDPDQGVVEVHTQRDGLWTRVLFAEPGAVTPLPPFGVAVDVAAWWPRALSPREP